MDSRLPHSLLGMGLFLGAVAILEVTAVAVSTDGFPLVTVANLLSSLPFLLVLVGGGYWLQKNGVRTDRYRRVGGWVLVGFLFFVLFFAVIAVFTQEDLLARIAIMRWAATTGAGIGLLVGILEARAIERAIAAGEARIRNEELRRQNERLEEFAGIIAHDLRNPLNVASGNVDISRTDRDDERLERASDALDRMEEIVEETLTLARSGQIIEDPERVDLSTVAEQSWRNVATSMAELGVEASATIEADPDRLRHLFENLFRNAVEHGGPGVTVRVGTLPDGFYVEDDGSGIPEDERESVLEAGYSTADGTGFGLAIVEQVASAHGWEIDVTEGADGGARFEFGGVRTTGTGGFPALGSRNASAIAN